MLLYVTKGKMQPKEQRINTMFYRKYRLLLILIQIWLYAQYKKKEIFKAKSTYSMLQYAFQSSWSLNESPDMLPVGIVPMPIPDHSFAMVVMYRD